MFIDAHCHVDFYKDDEIEKIIKRCRKKGVVFVDNSTRVDNIKRVLAMREKYPETVRVALGIYPIDALKLEEKELDDIIKEIREEKENIVAIGEVGMDFKESQEKEKQKKIFRKFVSLSIELDKPIIVHSRKAELDCIQILEEMKAKKVVMHCFSGKLSLVKRIVENKWALTIPTSVKNAEHFQKVIEIVPISQLLCETDSPYLHPDKERNNEPANVIVSYEKIAEIKKLKLEEVEKQIEENYKSFF